MESHIVGQRLDAAREAFPVRHQSLRHIVTLLLHPAIVDNDILVAGVFVAFAHQPIGGSTEQLLAAHATERKNSCQ